MNPRHTCAVRVTVVVVCVCVCVCVSVAYSPTEWHVASNKGY